MFHPGAPKETSGIWCFLNGFDPDILFKTFTSQVWWFMLVISALGAEAGRLRV
jgi:hypothetical protein